MQKTDLSGVDLVPADLSGANLSSADLRGAIGITTEELEQQADSLAGANMPDGSKYPLRLTANLLEGRLAEVPPMKCS